MPKSLCAESGTGFCDMLYSMHAGRSAIGGLCQSTDIQTAVQACCSTLGRPLGPAEQQLVCALSEVAHQSCQGLLLTGAPGVFRRRTLTSLAHRAMAPQSAQGLSKDGIFTHAAWLQIERLKQNWYSTAADVITMSEVSILLLDVTEHVNTLSVSTTSYIW